MKTTEEKLETWYEISRYSTEIKELKVVSRTDKTIIVRHGQFDGSTYDRRAFLNGEQFPTLAEAEAAVLKRLENDVHCTSQRLDRAAKKLQDWKASHQ